MVVRLIVELLAPTERMRICDPTAGSGGMLIECAHYIERKGGNPRNLTLHGQEKNLSTWGICKMNMLLVIDGRRRQPRAGRRRTVGTAAGGEAVCAQPSPCEWQRMSARRCAKWRQPCGDPLS